MHKITCSLVLACLIPLQIACVKRVIVKQDSQNIQSKLIYVTLVSGKKLELTDPEFQKEHLAGTLRADGQKVKIPLDEIDSIEALANCQENHYVERKQYESQERFYEFKFVNRS